MGNTTKKIIGIILVLFFIIGFCTGCDWAAVDFFTFLVGSNLPESRSDVENLDYSAYYVGDQIGFQVYDENNKIVKFIHTPLKQKEDSIVPVPAEVGTTSIPSSSGSLSVGHDPNIDFSKIVQSASEPPQDQIPVVDMPQDAPDIPQQDEGVTVADAELPPDSPIQQPDDSSPIGGKPDDEPQDTPDTTEEEPSFGEQEQPHHEHDIYTYYDPELYPGENTQTITISVNIETGEVTGHFDFAGYVGDSGYRTATYNFDTYLDSGSSFSARAEGIIYEDGQYFDEAYYIVTGTLSSDKSHIEGEIIDELYTDMSAPYYAELISQTEEQPETEEY